LVFGYGVKVETYTAVDVPDDMLDDKDDTEDCALDLPATVAHSVFGDRGDPCIVSTLKIGIGSSLRYGSLRSC
jgi:hypothetical protein